MSIDEFVNGLPSQKGPLPEPTPALRLDEHKYLPLIEEFEMAEAQKVELLRTLWSIMCTFVELGLPVDICGQVFDEIPPASEQGLPGVDSDQSMDDEPPSGARGRRREDE